MDYHVSRSVARTDGVGIVTVDIQKLRELVAEVPAGPWHWSGYPDSPYLANWENGYGRCMVMGFVRAGMRGGQPTFPTPGHLMVRGKDIVQYEVPYRDNIVGFDNPVARYLAGVSPDVLLELLDRLEEAEAHI